MKNESGYALCASLTHSLCDKNDANSDFCLSLVEKKENQLYLFEVSIQPLVKLPMPQNAVLGFQHKVGFVGEEKEAAWDTE